MALDGRRHPLQTLEEGWRRYGDVVRFPLLAGRPRYLLAHPDHVRRVLQERHENYPKPPTTNVRMRALVGESILTSQGDAWRRRRRLEQPAFHPERIAALGAMMVDLTAAMLDRWSLEAAGGRVLDVAKEMRTLTLSIVSKAMFSVDLGSQAEAIGQAIGVAHEHTNRWLRSHLALPQRLPLPSRRRYRRARRALDDLVDHILVERSAERGRANDLVSMLLTGGAGGSTGMSEQEVHDEIFGMLFVGHDTTANALTWTCYLLSEHPLVSQRLRAEVADVLAGRPPLLQDLPRLPYLQMVLDEALRLYPPAWGLSRFPRQDDEIGGYTIPAGSTVLLIPYITHRHPAFWDDPVAFDPERFSPERATARPHYAYFPFGGGPRSCLGSSFALAEARLVLAMVSQRFDLQLAPGHTVDLQPLVTLRPRGGLPMTLTPV
jgi:cytochrome P450